MVVAELNEWLSQYRPFGKAKLPDALEACFLASEREPQRKIAVLGLSLGILFYIVLLPLDYIVDEPLFRFDLLVRLGIGLPLTVMMLLLLLSRKWSAKINQIAATLAACAAPVTFSVVFAHSETVAGLVHLSVNISVMAFAVCLLGLATWYVVVICAVSIASMVAAAMFSPLGNATVAFSFVTAGMFVALPSILANHWLQSERRRNFVVMRRDEYRLERIAQQQALMEKLAAVDPLTQIANRRGFDAQLDDALAHSPDGRLVVAMIDVDFFKLFNDTYGHQSGDEVLRSVALAMAETCGSVAYVGRMGGEEFAVAAAGMRLDEFAALMEKLRGAIENLKIPHRRSEAALVVTVSIGIASGIVDDVADRSTLFRKADEALYVGKTSGRNRVHLIDPDARRLASAHGDADRVVRVR